MYHIDIIVFYLHVAHAPGIQLIIRSGSERDIIMSDNGGPGSGAKSVTQHRVIDQTGEGIIKTIGIALTDKHTISPVIDDIWNPANGSGHDRSAHRHGLKQGHGQPLPAGRHGNNIY
jgi:hypothetical protein